MHWLVIPMFACDWDCVRTAKRLWSFCLLVSDVFEAYLWCFLLPLLLKSEDQSCGAALKYLAFARVESWIVVSCSPLGIPREHHPETRKTLQHPGMSGSYAWRILLQYHETSLRLLGQMAQSMAMTYDPDRKIRTNKKDPPLGLRQPDMNTMISSGFVWFFLKC